MIDVNDPPTSITLLSKGIYENATAGTVVGVLQAQDEDANQSHYFQLISSQGMFRITGYSIIKAGLYVEAALKVQVFTTTSYNPKWPNVLRKFALLEGEDFPLQNMRHQLAFCQVSQALSARNEACFVAKIHLRTPCDAWACLVTKPYTELLDFVYR